MRTAQVAVTPEMLAKVAQLLADGGLQIVGSLDSVPSSRMVNLVVEGDALPATCNSLLNGLPRPIVVVFHQQIYGSQRLTRIDEIREAAVVRPFAI